MSQKGRREFLTSAAAAAAALAACTAPARRAQAQPACATMYDEHGIVGKVAPFVHNTAFRDQLITFPAATTPTMANLTQQLVENTLNALKGKGVTTVTVTKGTNVPLGTYELVSWGNPSQPGKRSPVVLTLAQEQAGSFVPDWSRILLFVIPDRLHGGHDITTADASSKMCIHPFGM
jgi:hypothetical protein